MTSTALTPEPWDRYGVKAQVRLIAAAPTMLAALERAERKLSAYVGVCKGDKELTNTVLPMVRTAIARATS